MDYRVLREALRQERERADLTLDHLAERSGVNRATIHSIENIKREPDLRPELHTIERLVRALGLTLSDFFVHVERIESSGLTDGEVGVTTRVLSQQRVQGGAGADTSVSDEQHAFLDDLVWACLRAADVSDREHVAALFEELVVSFRRVQDRGVDARTEVRNARAARRTQAS